MFESLTLHWLESASPLPGVEGWLAFRERVQRGMARMLTSAERGQRIAAFAPEVARNRPFTDHDSERGFDG